MNFTYEDKPDKLLIPQTSPLAFDTDWLRNNFPSPVRYAGMMITADNVLAPEVMMKVDFLFLAPCLFHIDINSHGPKPNVK